MKKNHDYIAITPKIIETKTNKVQQNTYAIPTLTSLTINYLHKKNKFRKKILKFIEHHNELIEIPYISSCFMMLKTSILKKRDGLVFK